MTVHMFPARRPAAPMTPERAAEIAQRDRVVDAQVDVLSVLDRHRDLGLAGDVQVLAVVLEYLSKAHGVPTGTLAMAAMSSDGGKH